ncbi:MAG: diaminobutyrate acetyltransferase [Thermodesulfobacteriota bacterium]
MDWSDPLELCEPDRGDGPAMMQIARETGVLSVNSAYYYALMARRFQDTCMVARCKGALCAYTTGFFLPRQPNTLFVWQVGVATAAQGRGIGRKVLTALIEKARPAFIEATIVPGNTASIRLFQSAARHFEAAWAFSNTPFFTRSDMGPDETPEHLMRIGPIHLQRQNM